MSLTRRSLLGASGAGIAIGLLDLAAGPAAAHPSTGTGGFGIVDRKTLPLTTYSGDWLSQSTLPAPVFVELSDSSGGLGSFGATIAFDQRLFEAAHEVDLFQGSTVRTVAVTVMPSLSDGRGQLFFSLDRGLGNDEDTRINFAVPVTRRPLYPTENVGAAAPFSILITSSGGVAPLVREWIPNPGMTGLAPWSLELSAGWGEIATKRNGRADVYRYPQAISAVNLGPFATPPGRLLVDVDPMVISSLSLETATLEGVALDAVGTQSADLLTRRLSVMLPVETPAGSTLIVRVLAEGVSGGAILTSVRNATASFATDPATLRPRRTGSAVDLVDLTNSGNPLSFGSGR